MNTQQEKFVYFGSVFDDEMFKDCSVPHLPVDHIILWSTLKKLIAVSTTPNMDTSDLATFYKVVEVGSAEKTSAWDRFFRIPPRSYVGVAVVDKHGDAKTVWIREEVAQSLSVEVSRKAHIG